MSRAKPVSRSSFLDPREVPRSLLVTSAVMLVLRVVWIFRFREIDADAYGHYFIAVATRRDPGNIHVHWVWLPLFHFVVGAFTKIGLTFRGVRLAGALLATLPPLLVWDALRPRNGEVARYAALAFAVSPLLTILGQSAQPEMLFLVFVTASLHAAAKERPLRAGVWLALACLVRYEAWGAALAAGVWWLGKDRTRAWLAFAAVPCATVALYILLRWWTDGALLLFFRGTREAQVAREAWTFDDVIDFRSCSRGASSAWRSSRRRSGGRSSRDERRRSRRASPRSSSSLITPAAPTPRSGTSRRSRRSRG